MRFIVHFLLITLYFFQNTTNTTAYVLANLLLLLVFVFFNKERLTVKIPVYFQFALLVYVCYLIWGLSNSHIDPQIDIKFQIYILTFYFIVLNTKNIDWSRTFFWINLLTFGIYIFLYLGYIPNMWSDTTVGFRGRINGPSMLAINIFLMLYVLEKRKPDRLLWISMPFAIIYLLLTTNFMNLSIAIMLFFLVLFDVKKVFTPRVILVSALLFFGIVSFLRSSYVPELISQKAEYIYRPWEYGSIKTRIEDYEEARRRADFGVLETLIGEGFGASTSIYRDNRQSPSLSATYNFLEIDNGFYYMFHRGGLLLLFLFLFGHLILFLKAPGLNAKLAFLIIFMITNVLSIHYFKNSFYVLLPFFILHLYGAEITIESKKLLFR